MFVIHGLAHAGFQPSDTPAKQHAWIILPADAPLDGNPATTTASCITPYAEWIQREDVLRRARVELVLAKEPQDCSLCAQCWKAFRQTVYERRTGRRA